MTALLAVFLGFTGFSRAAGTPRVAKDRLTWMADNGNGTFTNPLFYDEFSDPDIIRVGDDYYMTGTTMHAMPGLPVLHSRDLVNWTLLTYAVEELNLGPRFRMEGDTIYGQGIWAPCLRYHQGEFIIFSNVNGQKTQVFRAKNPAGAWTQSQMDCSLHDLSVLFDDDGKVYVVWGYNELKIAELKPDLSGIVKGTERVLIAAGSGMGEGAHFYKIDGRYYLFSTNYDPMCYQVVARANHVHGPYEVTTTSAGENFGVGTSWRLQGLGRTPGIRLIEPQPGDFTAIPLHQGGIVQVQSGEWWAVSMMDHNAVGRVTCLSPVTWEKGWPYLGLPGNLTRSPLTWIKPNTGFSQQPQATYERSDDFSNTRLKPLWQWNHVPDNTRWSLSERPGVLRLHSTKAPDFWNARNSLTQRAVGPESLVTVELDCSGQILGDVAGLALLNLPYAWIGVKRTDKGSELVWFDQTKGSHTEIPLATQHLWLRVHCDFHTDIGSFSYSVDGVNYSPFGAELKMPYQLKTFQGLRYALFCFNENGQGGYADFDNFQVDEPKANGRRFSIPLGKTITLTSLLSQKDLHVWNGLLRSAAAPTHALGTNRFRVLDRGKGRIALQAEDGAGYLSVNGAGEAGDLKWLREEAGESSQFQWVQTETGDVLLMSILTHRYVTVEPWANGLTSTSARGIATDRKNGTSFSVKVLDTGK